MKRKKNSILSHAWKFSSIQLSFTLLSLFHRISGYWVWLRDYKRTRTSGLIQWFAIRLSRFLEIFSLHVWFLHSWRDYNNFSHELLDIDPLLMRARCVIKEVSGMKSKKCENESKIYWIRFRQSKICAKPSVRGLFLGFFRNFLSIFQTMIKFSLIKSNNFPR